MGKKLSEDVIISDSDEPMEDAPETTDVNEETYQKSSISISERNAASSSSGSESENQNDSDSSEESESEERSEKTKIRQPSDNRSEYVFAPPPGFKRLTPETRPSAAISSALSNLEGKQVFHITAPSSVPVSQIKELALGKAMQGEPILSHKGVDYGLVQNAQQGSETLLVYNEQKNTFVRKQELKNIESYNIQEIVRLPGMDLIPQASSTQEAAKKQRPARPQPKHLKMRFHPVGSRTLPPETVGSSSESEAEEPTFRVPSKGSKGKNDKDTKRRSDEQGDPEKGSKKSKKEKQSSQETGPSRGREKTKSSKHRDETSQERRARKEEKKKRKAEKGH